MLLGNYHHSCRVTQLAPVSAWLSYFADAVVEGHPAVPGQDGRSAAADLETFPGRDWSRQPVMEPWVVRLLSLGGYCSLIRVRRETGAD